jgi:hypothetical protein
MNRSICSRFLVILLTLSLIACTADEVFQEDSSRANKQKPISSDLKPFLESYFATWSSGDMKGYKSHFHEFAIVTLVERGKVIVSVSRDKFVDLQKEIISKTTVRHVERMTSFTADEDAVAASVTAEWLLEAEREKFTGVDRFTLIRAPDGTWKIISLVFYSYR